jgi:purine-binding chemotaxis protein CheW
VTDTAGQYLTFDLGDAEYGVPVLAVREVVEYGAVTRVPGTPPWIRGAANLRGAVVAVVDLAVKFGLPASPPGRRTCIIVFAAGLSGEETAVGVVADAVNAVAEFPAAQIEPPPPFGGAVRPELLLGMARGRGKFVPLLDIEKVLSAGELSVARETAEPAAPAAAGEQPEDTAGTAPRRPARRRKER